MRQSIQWMGTGLLWALAACGKSSDGNAPTKVEEYTLRSVQSCEELESHIKATAIQDMQQQLEQLRSGSGWGYAVSDAQASSPARSGAESAATNASGGTAASSAPKASETNNQEQGVDEADLVKSDGNFIYVVTGNYLVIFKSFPASALQEVSRLKLQGNIEEMFIRGDRAVLFGSVYGDDVPKELQRCVGPVLSSVEPAAQEGKCGGWRSVSRIALVDISDRGAPKLARDVFSETSYVSSRLVNGSVRVVLNGYIDGPALELNPPYFAYRYGDPQDLSASERRALDDEIKRLDTKNRALIASTQLGDWLPRSVSVDYLSGARSEDLIAPCEQFYRGSRPDARGVVDIVTLNLDSADSAVRHAAILGYGSQVYASEKSVYVAAHPFWSWWGWRGNWDEQYGATRLHKFDIAKSPDTARYVGSGAVPGHVLNQFSLDEQDGYLRVATTTEAQRGIAVLSGGAGKDAAVTTSQNHLFVLGAAADGNLRVVGKVTGLAPGERVYSARFVGNTGYLVTFRQVDPLFTFDLSDPQAPRLVGELKIPGFSTYMHPIADGFLLTIGQDADANGRVTGMQLSIFDVRDLAQPKLAHKHVLEGRWSSSEALYNHKAFSYFAAQGLLAIPVSMWSYGASDNFVGLKTFRVNVETGIAPLADIDHSGYFSSADDRCTIAANPWLSQVRRSLTIEDHLYSISGRAVVATPLADLNAPATAAALLPWPDSYSYFGSSAGDVITKPVAPPPYCTQPGVVVAGVK